MVKVGHKELCLIAEKFLRGRHRQAEDNITIPKCTIVTKELKTCALEIPDAIGWSWGTSFLIEVKTSIADFKKDQSKNNKILTSGMGDFRYYLTKSSLEGYFNHKIAKSQFMI